MITPFRFGRWKMVLVRRGEPLKQGAVQRFSSLFDARELLQRAASDPMNAAIFRETLAGLLGAAPLLRTSTPEVVEQLARRLAAGSLEVRTLPETPVNVGRVVDDAQSEASAFAPTFAPRPTLAPKPKRTAAQSTEPAAAQSTEPEDDALLSSIEVAAQAATLVQAAKGGVPFCEICEKARGRAA